MAPCGCCPIATPEKAPPVDDDAPSNGKRRSKRKRVQKERCAINRVHEWYTETISETSEWNGVTFTDTYRVRTCIHCWKVKKKWLPRRLWREGRNRVLPKREVQF